MNKIAYKNPNGVKLLRTALDVSGKILVPTKYTEEQIDQQISIFNNFINRNEDDIKAEQSRIVNDIDYSLSEEEVIKFISNRVRTYYGIPDGLIKDFWRNFGSALMYKEHEKSSKANVGMDRIFGANHFSNCYSNIYDHERKIEEIIESYKFRASRPNEKIYSSPYSTVKELEENVTIKNSKKEAKKFWMDKTKSMDQRMIAFDLYGECEDWIHEPKHLHLKQLFNFVLGNSDHEEMRRGSKQECSYIVESWIWKLESNRCKISYNENKYHPKLIKTKRNYKPSKEAIERLTNYYYEILMQEGVSSFIIDW